MSRKTSRIALIGARGYTGGELLALVAGHPGMELAAAVSTTRAGRPLAEEVPAWPDPDTRFDSLEPGGVGEVEADAWVLALPNGQSGPWVEAIGAAHPDAVILDLGADHRFDAAWVYGLTEFNREALDGAKRIANPGCYATGAQFGLLPVRERLARPPAVFGVSGHSGAGRTPSPRNDPARLADNLIPYALTGHVHEDEIGAHLGRPVRFMPHVAAFFRGISLTIAVDLTAPTTPEELLEAFREAYDGEPLIRVGAEAPEVASLAPRHGLRIGGFAVDARSADRACWVVVLDNLLKGAATQAMQNLNLALGHDELAGIRLEEEHHRHEEGDE
ncbi:MAG: N-acetyl-gamma-glutamyl-phosphate reductase [Wenzhouxiangellaceae bacterium]|nr:N-acetyl-gamma-glutamyl-phosphate reductase [Wenzhouxiangellaceae bacterium]